MYFHRHMEAVVERIAKRKPVIVLTGARQVGKSTMLKTLYKNIKYVTLNRPLVRESAKENPSVFFDMNKPPVIVDEIQKAAELFDYIKKSMEGYEMEMKILPIIADTEFKNGFICSGAAHEDGIVGELKSPVAEGCAPDWICYQWACKNNIVKGEYAADENGYSYITESQKVAVSWKEGDPIIMLELKTSKEYDTPRVYGQPWPHLLIGQGFTGRCPTLEKLERLDLIFDTRIVYCDSHMEKADPALHAAQAQLFFTVSAPHDMYWFGVPVYDIREEFVAEFEAEDGGKADASHKYIYTVSQREFTEVSSHTFKRLKYEADLLPYIKMGLGKAHKSGYLNSNNPADYTLTSCNIGYEMPGIYDSAFELYNFALDAVVIVGDK